MKFREKLDYFSYDTTQNKTCSWLQWEWFGNVISIDTLRKCFHGQKFEEKTNHSWHQFDSILSIHCNDENSLMMHTTIIHLSPVRRSVAKNRFQNANRIATRVPFNHEFCRIFTLAIIVKNLIAGAGKASQVSSDLRILYRLVFHFSDK